MIYLLGTLAASVAAFVLYPVFATDGPDELESPDELAYKLRELIEQKARLMDVIKDLEFEHESGKVPQGDFEASRTDYVNQVASVLRQIDELSDRKGPKGNQAPNDPPPTEPSERTAEKPPAETASDATEPCPHCEAHNPQGARFCMHCGEAMHRPSLCASCSTELPPDARFCLQCGEKVRDASSDSKSSDETQLA